MYRAASEVHGNSRASEPQVSAAHEKGMRHFFVRGEATLV